MLNKIYHIAKQDAREALYYRFDLFLYIFNYIVEITVYVFIWMSIYNNGSSILGMSLKQVTTYYILVVTLYPIMFWGINDIMGEAIREGEILRELLNPISYFSYYFGVRLGEFFEAVIVAVATFIICSILFGALLPSSLINFLFFILVICLGMVIIYFFELILGMSAFYTDAIWGIEVLKRAIINIFSGMIAPIALFPNFFQKIANVLPFKDCIYTPINIYFGNLSTSEIFNVLLKQCFWIFFLYVIAKIIFKKAIKSITINGG